MTAAWAPVVADAELERLIAAYGNDFTADARAGRFDPITGRDAELDDLGWGGQDGACDGPGAARGRGGGAGLARRRAAD